MTTRSLVRKGNLRGARSLGASLIVLSRDGLRNGDGDGVAFSESAIVLVCYFLVILRISLQTDSESMGNS
jgi:hypothetical protein